MKSIIHFKGQAKYKLISPEGYKTEKQRQFSLNVLKGRQPHGILEQVVPKGEGGFLGLRHGRDPVVLPLYGSSVGNISSGPESGCLGHCSSVQKPPLSSGLPQQAPKQFIIIFSLSSASLLHVAHFYRKQIFENHSAI